MLFKIGIDSPSNCLKINLPQPNLQNSNEYLEYFGSRDFFMLALICIKRMGIEVEKYCGHGFYGRLKGNVFS